MNWGSRLTKITLTCAETNRFALYSLCDRRGARFFVHLQIQDTQESESDTRSYPGQDRAHTQRQSAQHRCGTEPHAPGLVRLLQARSSVDLRRHGWLRAAPVAHAAAQAAETTRGCFVICPLWFESAFCAGHGVLFVGRQQHMLHKSRNLCADIAPPRQWV